MLPLKTRDGVADAPIEPGARTLCEPWPRGPRAEAVALDRALEALADADAGDLDLVARLEELDRDGLALDGAVDAAAELDQAAVRAEAGLREVAELGLRELPLGDRVERELHGVVAVRVGGLHLHDRARAGLDHGDRGDGAGLRVEDLGHAELLAEDAFPSRA